MADTLFHPSEYQRAIFDWVKSGTGNAVVEAVAGSGKTTTIVEALKLMTGRVMFCAYNTAIKNELARRAPAGVAVSTIHAHGFAAIRNAYRYFKPDDQKMRRIVEEVYDDNSWQTRPIRAAIEKLAALTRQTLTDRSDEKALLGLIERYDIDVNGDAEVIARLIPKVLEKCTDLEAYGMDFTDMVWLPVELDLWLRKFDWVCVDETQDLNAAQRELVMRSVRPGGRVIAVGDRKQSIYGFAGADTDSIPTFIERLDAKVLPLSICYRCPTKHIELAKEIVPAIRAKDGAATGVVDTLTLDTAMEQMSDGNLVLCRINAPLANVALGLIRQGKKAVIKGREIGTGLVNLVKRMRRAQMEPLLDRLAEYRAKEVTKLEKKKKHVQAQHLSDKVDTIFALADGIKTVEALKARIERIFSNDNVGIVCSSVHKAKGLEAEKVFIYLPELLPFPRASQDWEIDQETHLRYVALTRSKDTLIFIPK